jgi:poly(A) polymerase
MQIQKVCFQYPEYYEDILRNIRLHGGSIRLVGGCVRDFLLSRTANDFDFATDLLPAKLLQIFLNTSFKVIPLGLEYGTILLTRQKYSFEITTIREDVICLGRKAVVKFTQDWKKDAFRRDFTINALSIDENSILYDYTTGLEDLKKRKIKFILNPVERIFEDKLRILRFFRFLSYFGIKHLDAPSLSACIKYCYLLEDISPERKRLEFLKLLSGQNVLEVVKILIEENLLKYLGFSKERVDHVKISSLQFVINDAVANLAITLLLFPSPREELILVKKNLKLTKSEYRAVEKFISFREAIFTDYYHYKYLHELGDEDYKRLLLVIRNFHKLFDYDRYYNDISHYVGKIFPVNGQDLIKINIQGKMIGSVLKDLKKHWHNHQNMLTKEQLIKLIC